ncbi:MAG: hypothetical protein NC328_06295, partial [Muribaculum sp.]|nr:hypothetical protein [Muribaculum sp.]
MKDINKEIKSSPNNYIMKKFFTTLAVYALALTGSAALAQDASRPTKLEGVAELPLTDALRIEYLG